MDTSTSQHKALGGFQHQMQPTFIGAEQFLSLEAETWADRSKLEAFDKWIWRKSVGWMRKEMRKF